MVEGTGPKAAQGPSLFAPSPMPGRSGSSQLTATLLTCEDTEAQRGWRPGKVTQVSREPCHTWSQALLLEPKLQAMAEQGQPWDLPRKGKRTRGAWEGGAWLGSLTQVGRTLLGSCDLDRDSCLAWAPS